MHEILEIPNTVLFKSVYFLCSFWHRLDLSETTCWRRRYYASNIIDDFTELGIKYQQSHRKQDLHKCRVPDG